MKFHIPLLIGLAASLGACSMLSGPSDSTVEELARKSMVQTLGQGASDPAAQAALKAAVDKASISKKGMCNNTDPKIYACMVDVTITMPGESSETTQTFVVEATKDAQDNWTVAED